MRILLLLFKIILVIALIIAIALGIFLLYSTLTDVTPEETIDIKSEGDSTLAIDTSALSLLIWNIGYCGLGAEIDFFYDGGSISVTPKDKVDKYLKGMKSFLAKQQDQDFILLQEVDYGSRRSHYTKQDIETRSVLPGFNSTKATNYDVKFVPLPFSNPMGRAFSGLQTLSRYNSVGNTRYQFPGNYDWPNKLFFLDRCFLLQRFPFNGKEFVVINTHNSAYDNGDLKKQQMEYLKTVLTDEYEKGNYVIVGGDWNQTPPNFDNNTFTKPGGEKPYDQIPVSESYLPGWEWAFDPTVPTNRKVRSPYNKSTTFTTVIDYFLVSPNIKVESVRGLNLDFEFSDHQPVEVKIRLQ